MPTTILTHNQTAWLNITNPTPEDIQEIAARFPNFHPLNLQDCLTELEIPKLNQNHNYVFLVVQLPIWDPADRISRPAEIDIFLSRGALITSHRNELKPLTNMFAQAQSDETYRAELMERGASPLLYQLLNALVGYCFPIVHHIGRNVRRIEETIFDKNTRYLLNEVAVVRRDTITVRRILRSQISVIEALIRGNWPFIQEELDPYWGDIGDHLSQLCSMLDEYAEVISGLSDTVDALASHRIDEVVRLLTIITVLTLPLMVLATLFSMNITMPFAEHPALFYLVIGFGAGLAAITMWLLRRRRWF